MSSYKKLSKADVTTVNYHANKRWNLIYSSSINDSYAVASVGKNETFNITGSTTTNGQYKSLIYAEINHLFYQAYNGKLLNTSSIMMYPDTYESASQQRPTSSYFNYNNNPLLVKQFPTGAGETINVWSINQDIYGSKILPNSLIISSSDVVIRDDGNGNLYNVAGAQNQYIDLNYITTTYFSSGSVIPIGVEFVGNAFYAHGIIVFTNQSSSYQDLSTGSILFQNEHIIYENEVRCIVRESDFNLTYNPTILQYGGEYMVISGSSTPSGSTYTITGSLDSTVKDFATGSVFQPYVTSIGLYNDENELLMVAKLGKPIMLSPDTDMTFIVKYDT
jgi:hypothetical protein